MSRQTKAVTFHASGVKTASVDGQSYNLSEMSEGQVLVNVTAITGTVTPVFQTSDDNATWYDHTSGTAISAIGLARLTVTNFGSYCRCRLVIAGATPSVTAQVRGVFKS